MTADEMWMELKIILKTSSKSDTSDLRLKTQALLEFDGGLSRILKYFSSNETLPGELKLLAELSYTLQNFDKEFHRYPDQDRIKLLTATLAASRPYRNTDSSYWRCIYIIRTSDGADFFKESVANSASALLEMTKLHITPKLLVAKLLSLSSNCDFTTTHWQVVLSKTQKSVTNIDFSKCLNTVMDMLGSSVTPDRIAAETLAIATSHRQQIATKLHKSRAESVTPVTAEVTALTAPADASDQVLVADFTQTTPTFTTPIADLMPRPAVASVDVADAPATVSPPDAIPVIPKKARAKAKEVVTPVPEPPRGLDPELVAFFGDLVAAVRGVAGPQEQIGALTKEVVALGKRLDGHDRRIADAQRAEDEVTELRTRIQEQQSELNAARRERDAAVGREKELARLVADTDDRIDKSNARAVVNIHAAQRERDAAVLTFKAGLWDAVQAQVADITDPSPDEAFGSTEEKVIMTRLRGIRDALRREGVAP